MVWRGQENPPSRGQQFINSVLKNNQGRAFSSIEVAVTVGNAHMFFTSIAAQLTQKSPALKRYIFDAVGENRDISTRVRTTHS